MAKYARLNSAGLVMETCDGDPTTRFVESIASQFVEVDDNAATGDTVTDGTLVKYVAPEVTPPPAPTQPRLAPRSEVLDAMTRAQRVAIKNLRATDDEVDDFMAQMEAKGSLDLANAEDIALLDRLVTDSVLTAEVVTAIKALR